MAVKFKHGDSYTIYFCTFTCYNWLHLFEITHGYDLVYKCFDELKKNKQEVISYVIMPNHFHAILYFPQPGFDLNKIISNAKRLMAYEIIGRLKKQEHHKLLEQLSTGLTETEKN